MKRLILVCLLLYCSLLVKAQEPKNYRELILHVTNNPGVELDRLGKQLLCIPGVHFSGYYKPERCFLITYDSTYVSSDDIIETTVKHLNKNIHTETLHGLSIYELIDKGLPVNATAVTYQKNN